MILIRLNTWRMVKSNIYYYLFLLILLLRVIILEDELEKLVSTKETPELTTEAHQVLEQKLKFIQPHMQASNSCWEEAISQVEKMSGKNPNKKGKYESLIWQLMEYTLEMEWSNGSKTAFRLHIWILARGFKNIQFENYANLHVCWKFEKLYTCQTFSLWWPWSFCFSKNYKRANCLLDVWIHIVHF